MTSPVAWYAAGLRFSCQQCGNCCTGDAGFTWVSDAEVRSLAEAQKLDEATFRVRFTLRVWRNGQHLTSLKDQPGSRGRECVFFQNGTGCTVYDQRPQQCRTWPFWRRIIATPGDWREASRECPGMGKGPMIPAIQIQETARQDGLPD